MIIILCLIQTGLGALDSTKNVIKSEIIVTSPHTLHQFLIFQKWVTLKKSDTYLLFFFFLKRERRLNIRKGDIEIFRLKKFFICNLVEKL